MKKGAIYYIVLAISILTMSSCMMADDIKVEELTSLKMRGNTMTQTGVDVTALIANNGSKVTLLEGSLTLYDGDKEFLEVMLRDKAIIQRKSHEAVIVPLIIKYKNGLGPLGIIPLVMGGMDNVFISGSIKARGGMFTKKVKIEKMRLQEFSFQYGADLKTLIKDNL